MWYPFTQEEKDRINALNLRANKVGFSVHTGRTEKESGWFNIVKFQSGEPDDYESLIVRPPSPCKDLDEVEAFVIQKEKEVAQDAA